MNGYTNTLEFTCDSPKTATVNNESFELGQGCTNCDTWVRGAHNFTYCPNCGAMLAHSAGS